MYIPHGDRPTSKIINPAKEVRNSGACAMLPQGDSQWLPDKGRLPRKRAKNLGDDSTKLTR